MRRLAVLRARGRRLDALRRRSQVELEARAVVGEDRERARAGAPVLLEARAHEADAAPVTVRLGEHARRPGGRGTQVVDRDRAQRARAELRLAAQRADDDGADVAAVRPGDHPPVRGDLAVVGALARGAHRCVVLEIPHRPRTLPAAVLHTAPPNGGEFTAPATNHVAAAGRGRGAGHAARALLRPRLRARPDAVHGADGGHPDVGGPGTRRPRARRAVVVVGRLRLAHERRQPRGGHGSLRDLRRHGGPARGGAVRARGVRRLRPRVRGCLRRRARGADCPLPRREPWRGRASARAAQVRPGPRREHRCRRGPAVARLGHRRRPPGGPLGRRARRRHGGPGTVRVGGLEARARPLRRAPRPDHHHRARRVDRGDRRGRRAWDRRRGGRGRGAGSRGRRGTVVALLRPRGARGRPPARERGARARSRTRSRATRFRSSTSR